MKRNVKRVSGSALALVLVFMLLSVTIVATVGTLTAAQVNQTVAAGNYEQGYYEAESAAQLALSRALPILEADAKLFMKTNTVSLDTGSAAAIADMQKMLKDITAVGIDDATYVFYLTITGDNNATTTWNSSESPPNTNPPTIAPYSNVSKYYYNTEWVETISDDGTISGKHEPRGDPIPEEWEYWYIYSNLGVTVTKAAHTVYVGSGVTYEANLGELDVTTPPPFVAPSGASSSIVVTTGKGDIMDPPSGRTSFIKDGVLYTYKTWPSTGYLDSENKPLENAASELPGEFKKIVIADRLAAVAAKFPDEKLSDGTPNEAYNKVVKINPANSEYRAVRNGNNLDLINGFTTISIDLSQKDTIEFKGAVTLTGDYTGINIKVKGDTQFGVSGRQFVQKKTDEPDRKYMFVDGTAKFLNLHQYDMIVAAKQINWVGNDGGGTYDVGSNSTYYTKELFVNFSYYPPYTWDAESMPQFYADEIKIEAARLRGSIKALFFANKNIEVKSFGSDNGTPLEFTGAFICGKEMTFDGGTADIRIDLNGIFPPEPEDLSAYMYAGGDPGSGSPTDKQTTTQSGTVSPISGSSRKIQGK